MPLPPFSDLLTRRAYPSVSVLINTTPETRLAVTDRVVLDHMIGHADERLAGDVPDHVRTEVVAALRRLAAEQASLPASDALALFASPEHHCAVTLDRPVEERVVVDDTFATRDVVADRDRSMRFRVLTVSDHVVRHLVGDRRRLIEVCNDDWPLVREDDQGQTSWERDVVHRVRALHRDDPMPTVVAGVVSTVRAMRLDVIEPIGAVGGSHDRSHPAVLHGYAWPLVRDWLDDRWAADLRRLDAARSSQRLATGLDDIWQLAQSGQVELVVVEQSFAVPARLSATGHVALADDREAPDVVDDLVDDLIEAVLVRRGRVSFVADGALADEGLIAAVVRY